MKSKATLAAAVVVCSTAGFMIGRISSESNGLSDSQSSGGTIDPRIGLHQGGRDERGGIVGPRAGGQSNARDRSLSSGSSASQNSIGRMEEILNNPNPLERAENWLRFVKGLSPSEIEDVIVDFRGKGLNEDNLSEYSMLLAAWAKHDPVAALDYASENTRSPFARQTILATWAATDPLAAMKWAESNHDGEGANPWMVGVIRGIAASDPQRATELLNAMPYSEERGEALSAVMGHYLKQGPDAARAWAMSIQDERLRAGAISRIADSLARTDPQGTADWLLANSGQLSNTDAMNSVMQRMTEADPQAAVTYFERIADENYKSSAFEGIVDQMASTDPRAALTFIDSHSSLATDGVFREFVWSARREDPALGASSISRIQDVESRNRTYQQYIGRWMYRDFNGASAWVNQNQNVLPEAVLRSVETMANRIQNAER